MAKHKTSVHQLYTQHRIHPYGRADDQGAHHQIHSDGRHARHADSDMRPDDSEQYCQAPEDHHAPNYSNDTTGWVRGARGEPTGNNEDATGKANFDHSPPRSRMRR